MHDFRKISKRIFVIGIPIIIQSLVQFALIMTDIGFIGHYKISGLSAIQNAVAPFFILNSFFFALGQGLTILITQSIGAGKKKNAVRYAEAAFFFNQSISFIFLFFWLASGGMILQLVGSKNEILAMGRTYLWIMSFSFLTLGSGFTAGYILQGLGRTLPIMVVSIFKTALNVFLNWVLIFGKLGFPELGIAGSALGTLISNFLGDIITILIVFSLKDFSLRIRGIFRPHFLLFRRIISLSLPAGIEAFLWESGQTSLIVILNKIDPMASGYFTVMNMLNHLSFNFYIGFGIASLVLVGHATGAKKPKAALYANMVCLFYSFMFCIALAVIYSLFPKAVVGLFINSPAAIEKLAPLLFIIILVIFPKAVNVVTGNSIRGTGNTVWMMLTQVFGTVIIILTAGLLALPAGLGLAGVLIALFFDEFWRSILNLSKFIFSQNRKIKELSERRLGIIS